MDLSLTVMTKSCS